MPTRVSEPRSSTRLAVAPSVLAESLARELAVEPTDTEARVLALLLSRLELDVDVGTDVIESGVLDSIAFVGLLVELEREFGIAVSMSSLDLEDFRSARSIARYVERARD